MAGSSSSAIGTRTTRSVSAGSTTRTSLGSRQYATTGVTSKRDGGTNSFGSVATGCTPARSRPVSSVASRSAVSTGSRSPGSVAPPGKATCPRCWRMVAARWVSSTSASAGKPPGAPGSGSGEPPNSTSTAAWRGSAVSVISLRTARALDSESTGSRAPGSTARRSHAGVSAGISRVMPPLPACANARVRRHRRGVVSPPDRRPR
ncbi:Uncharacterised protein [Mycobacteroides abscessus subsp. abscessus]|nr:Uncharacterised protein [Mycobacteroides abscessus subsp. abscessus]